MTATGILKQISRSRKTAIDDPIEGPQFLHRMHIEVDGLAQMVTELLDLARAEAGRTSYDLAAQIV